jgi:hypothetical protein
MSSVINMVVANLAQDENLKAIHTIICCKMSDQPNSVAFQNKEEQVTRVLRDLKPSAVPAIGNNDVVVGSMVSFFTQQKNRSFQARSGKFQNRDAKAPENDSRSSIKKRPQPQRIFSTVWIQSTFSNFWWFILAIRCLDCYWRANGGRSVTVYHSSSCRRAPRTYQRK